MTVFTSKMITWREKNERNTISVDGGENKEKKAQLDISEKLNIAECKICILVVSEATAFLLLMRFEFNY